MAAAALDAMQRVIASRRPLTPIADSSAIDFVSVLARSADGQARLPAKVAPINDSRQFSFGPSLMPISRRGEHQPARLPKRR